MANVIATLVVDFSLDQSTGAGSLKLEVDSRSKDDGGLNFGRTSFAPGDTIYLLLYKPALLTNFRIFSTSGTLTSDGSETIPVEETITVSKSDAVSMPYPIVNNLSTAWLGGSVWDEQGSSASISRTQVSDQKLQLSESAIGALHVTYDTRASIYKLNSVPSGVEKVFLFAAGTL